MMKTMSSCLRVSARWYDDITRRWTDKEWETAATAAAAAAGLSHRVEDVSAWAAGIYGDADSWRWSACCREHRRSSSIRRLQSSPARPCSENLGWRTLTLGPLSAKLHYTDTGYGHHQRTSSQQYSTTCCTTNSPPTDKNCHIPTSWHVEVELLWARPLMVSVGGVVQHVRSRCPCCGVWAIFRMTTRCWQI